MTIGITLLLAAGGCGRPVPVGSGPPTAYPSRSLPPGDQAANNADNNGWKQRHELSPQERAAGRTIKDRVVPALEKLRRGGDIGPDAVARTLHGLGFATDDVQVTAMRALGADPTPPPGAAFGIHFPDRGCVVGDVRPERVRAEVTGSAAEFGCLEPFSH
ncbi:hypothetical protein [Luedemannella flava]|uniref:hypothetical protein n=1 Tax=Luedemannella flava TaxID=349316 RepID=UPI0031D33287